MGSLSFCSDNNFTIHHIELELNTGHPKRLAFEKAMLELGRDMKLFHVVPVCVRKLHSAGTWEPSVEHLNAKPDFRPG